MSKGRKTCHYCGTRLNNQNRDIYMPPIRANARWASGLEAPVWLPCCHACKHKQEKKER